MLLCQPGILTAMSLIYGSTVASQVQFPLTLHLNSANLSWILMKFWRPQDDDLARALSTSIFPHGCYLDIRCCRGVKELMKPLWYYTKP